MDKFGDNLDSLVFCGLFVGLFALLLVILTAVVLLAVWFRKSNVFSETSCCCRSKINPRGTLPDTTDKDVLGVSYISKSAASEIFQTAKSAEHFSTTPSAIIIHGSRSSAGQEPTPEELAFKTTGSDDISVSESKRPPSIQPRIRRSNMNAATEGGVLKRPSALLPIRQSLVDFDYKPGGELAQMIRPLSSHLTRQDVFDHAVYPADGEKKRVSKPQHLVPDHAACVKSETQPPSTRPLVRQSVLDYANTAQTVNSVAGRFVAMARSCLGKARRSSAQCSDAERGELGEGRAQPRRKTIYETYLDVRSAQVSLLAAELMLRKDDGRTGRHVADDRRYAFKAGTASSHAAGHGELAGIESTAYSGEFDSESALRLTATGFGDGATSGCSGMLSSFGPGSCSLDYSTLPLSYMASLRSVSSSDVLSPPSAFTTHFPPNRSSTPFPPNGPSMPSASKPPSAVSGTPARDGCGHFSYRRKTQRPRTASVSPVRRTNSSGSGGGDQSPLFMKLMSRYLAAALSHHMGGRASGSATTGGAGAAATTAASSSAHSRDQPPYSAPPTTAGGGRPPGSATTRTGAIAAVSAPKRGLGRSPNSEPATLAGGRVADSAVGQLETTADSSSSTRCLDESVDSVPATPSRLSALSVILPEDSFNGAVTEAEVSTEERQRERAIPSGFVETTADLTDDPISSAMPDNISETLLLDNRTFLVSKRKLQDGENHKRQNPAFNPPEQRPASSSGSEQCHASVVRKASTGASILMDKENSFQQLEESRQPSCPVQRRIPYYDQEGLQKEVFDSQTCKTGKVFRGRTSKIRKMFERKANKPKQGFQYRMSNIQVSRGRPRNARQIFEGATPNAFDSERREPYRNVPSASSVQEEFNPEAITGLGNAFRPFSSISLTSSDTDSYFDHVESSTCSTETPGYGGPAYCRGTGSDGSCEASDSSLSSSSPASSSSSPGSSGYAACSSLPRIKDNGRVRNVSTSASSSGGSPLYDNAWRVVPRVSAMPPPVFSLMKTSL